MIRSLSQLTRGSGWRELRSDWPWQPGTPTELQTCAFRSGPLFVLRDTVDNSRLLPNGKLIRSSRLARLEAVLLISRGALPSRRIAQLAGLVDGNEAQQLIELLNSSYDLSNSAFRIERTATGFLMMTRPVLVSWLDRLHQRQSQMRLSQPMMETLTIIGYQQPVTRATVEAVRGVQSAEMIRQLIDRGLVQVGGEEDTLGRPFLYVTTRAFLDMFGLGRIEDLPDFDTIGRKHDPAQSETVAADIATSPGKSITDSEFSETQPEQDSSDDQHAA